MATWAAVGKVADLTYDGTAHQLFTGSEDTYTYFVGTSATLPENPAWTAFADIDNLKKTNAGTYYLWYKEGNNEAVSLGAVTINPRDYSTWTVTATIGSNAAVVYDGTAKNPVVKLTKQGETDIVLTNGVEGWVLEWDAETIKNFGTYTVTVASDGRNVAPTVNHASVSITKKPIVVKPNDVNGTFGTEFTAFTYNYGDVVDADKEGEDIKEGVFNGTIEQTVVKGTGAGAVNYAARSGVGNYTITIVPTSLTAQNYSITFETGTLTIAELPLNAAWISAFSDKTYNGNVQKPADTEFIVNDGVANLVKGAQAEANTDYYVTYTAGGTDYKNAGTYNITFNGQGNYSGSIVKTLTIKKKPLGVKTVSNGADNHGTAHTYDGKAINADGQVFVEHPEYFLDFIGLVEGDGYPGILADNAKPVTLSLARKTEGSNDFKGAGTYTIKAGNYAGETANTMFTNYLPSYANSGVYTISKAALTIEVHDQTKVYGELDPVDWAHPGVGVVYADPYDPAAQDAVHVKVSGMVNAETYAQALSTLPTIQRAGGDDVNTTAGYALTAVGAVASANYEIKTNTPGKLLITKATVSIFAQDKGSVYGQNIAELKADIYGMTDEDLSDVQTAVNHSLTTTATSTSPVVAGGYPITFGNLDFTAPVWSNYDVANIALFPGTYTISKADLTSIVVKPQALVVNNTVADLGTPNADMVVIGGTVQDADIANILAAITYKFDAAQLSTANSKLDGDGKLLAAAVGQYTGGIQIVIGELTNYNAPDPSIITYGDLTVLAADAGFLALGDDDLTAVLAAANGVMYPKVKLNFATRKLTGEKWNTLVLPFETTVKEVSERLGYAVVDILDKTKGDGNVHFKLHMGTIPANTPFMVKAYEDKNLTNIEFVNKTIVYETTGDASIITATSDDEWLADEEFTGDAMVADGSGNKLYGTYKTTGFWKDATKGQYRFMTSDETWNQADATASSTAPKTQGTLRAILYIAPTVAAPKILIEEPDGSTTTISAISAEGVAVAAEGWYNLNGVKLQGVPTEKGVYINNGKKVVLK